MHDQRIERLQRFAGRLFTLRQMLTPAEFDRYCREQLKGTAEQANHLIEQAATVLRKGVAVV